MSTDMTDDVDLKRIARRLKKAVARKNVDFSKRAVEIGAELNAAKEKYSRGRTGEFAKWVRRVLGWSRMRAYQWMEAADIVNNCLQYRVHPPANEGQARAIAAIPKAHRMQVWEACVAESNKNMDLITAAKITARGEPHRKEKEPTEFSSIIKPSDNWNFSPVYYGRIDEDSHGYIPGEIYANCFWYYVENGWDACDLMAGSGQALRVYEDRSHWGRGREIEFNLRLFDINPRGRYADKIEKLDARDGFPNGYSPDYIFMDLPYFGMVDGAYSDSSDDMANMPYEQYEETIGRIARSCSNAQKPGSLCTVMAPSTVDWDNACRHLIPRCVQTAFRLQGYLVHDVAYATRRIQQNPAMAFENNAAKKNRLMLSDMAEIQTFKFFGK